MMLSDYIVKLLNEVAVQEGFIDYKLDLDAGSKHGDNFIGVMIAVKLIGTKEINGETKSVTKHLICKLPPSDPMRRRLYQPILAFEREVEVYSTLLPTFVQFQKEKGLTPEESFISFPHARVAVSDMENDNHILIMDDLRQQNFRMFPKERRTNIEHATLVMKEMAKFHAISFALKDQRPKQFEQLKQGDVYIEMVKRGKLKVIIDESLDRAYRMINNDKHKQVLDDLRKNYFEIFQDCGSDELLDGSGVITHGDCWNNNFLFKYSKTEGYENPSSIMILDWQVSRYGPIALDIFYFISTASDKAFRSKHYHSLMKTYHSTLSASIEKLGSDPQIYPFEKFNNDLKKYSMLGVFFGSFMTQYCLAEQKDVLDVDEYCRRIENGEKCNLLMNFDDNATFRTLVNDLLDDFSSYGYFN